MKHIMASGLWDQTQTVFIKKKLRLWDYWMLTGDYNFECKAIIEDFPYFKCR